MKLWVDGKNGSPGAAIRATIKGQVGEINRKVMSRGVRVVNVIRTAELEVLKGQRSGRVYKKPGTHGAALKHTKMLLGEYGHKLRGGQLYRASASGEPPAKRTGALRMHWTGDVEPSCSPEGVKVTAYIESQEKYAAYLEYGTNKIAPRPFVEKIKEKAQPEIEKIFKEPYD